MPRNRCRIQHKHPTGTRQDQCGVLHEHSSIRETGCTHVSQGQILQGLHTCICRAGLLDMSLGICATATQKDDAYPPWSDTLVRDVV